jgi:hypothetical protein
MANKPRARDLGVPFEGEPGPHNAITDVPGVEAKDIEILLTGNRLTINGTRIDKVEKGEEGEYYARERTYGRFTRSFTLPEGADLNAVQANLNAGVLTIVFPKVPAVQPKKIPVTVEKAANVLDFHPQYSNKDALIRNYRWYVEHLDQFKNATGISHRVPWKQGLLKLAKVFF